MTVGLAILIGVVAGLGLIGIVTAVILSATHAAAKPSGPMVVRTIEIPCPVCRQPIADGQVVRYYESKLTHESCLTPIPKPIQRSP